LRFSYLPTLRLILKLQAPPEQTLQLLRLTRLNQVTLPIVQQSATRLHLPTLQMVPDLRIRQQIQLLHLKTKPATPPLLPTLQMAPSLWFKTPPATGQLLPTLQMPPSLKTRQRTRQRLDQKMFCQTTLNRSHPTTNLWSSSTKPFKDPLICSLMITLALKLRI
jgi:hypothetical protein